MLMCKRTPVALGRARRCRAVFFGISEFEFLKFTRHGEPVLTAGLGFGAHLGEPVQQGGLGIWDF